MNEKEYVMDIAFGRWRSQVLYSGVTLNVFDHCELSNYLSANEVANMINVDSTLLYRLMRALASLNFLSESDDKKFKLTKNGLVLRADSPGSLRNMVLLEEGPVHYALWKHLPSMIRDGQQNAFVREFDSHAFDYTRSNADYGEVFKQAMTSFSFVQSALVLEALKSYDFSPFGSICDIAGGHGHLLCSLLEAHPHLEGRVLDLPEVVADSDSLWATRLNLQNRCEYIGGDMFDDVPRADLYTLKMILHDWNDDECVKILTNIRQRVRKNGRVFIAEHIIPGTSQAHFAKVYDIHMMCWGSGCERTEEQYVDLLTRSGWTLDKSYYPSGRLMGVVVGVAV